MEPMEIARQYFDAWNRRDANAITALFADGGTYSDPATPGPLTGPAIGAYAQGLWVSFPDLSFEIASSAKNDSGLIAAQWLMTGTNAGPFGGLPPSGKTISLPGADFIQVEGDKIRSVQGYFDSRALPVALGLDVIVQPPSIGPFTLGTAARVHAGSSQKPGAFSITVLEARNADDHKVVGELSQKIAAQLPSLPGFISWVGVTIGERKITLTAWEKPGDSQQLMQDPTHRDAMQKFFGPDVAGGGYVSEWVPDHINRRLARCTACSRMMDRDANEVCTCGARLPDPLAYW
jgi:steroid delta-isomerase-like uncharacterized protein